jgi:hypothetical protein
MRAPRSQVPCPGVPADPVAEQRGHGCDPLPVTKTCDDSGTLSDNVPVPVFTLPPALLANELTTQVERPAFAIGSGGPKAQPEVVQSMPGPPPTLGDSEHALPEQPVTRKRFVAPSGIGPSGTVDPPPPRSSEPHARFLMTALLPFFDEPHAPLPLAVEKSSTTVPGAACVDVVVLVVVDVLVVVGPWLLVVVGAADVDVVL